MTVLVEFQIEIRFSIFVFYLKIINTFWKKVHFFKELKNGYWNFSKQSGFLSYGSKRSKCCLDQLLKNRLAYLNFMIFLSSLDNLL